MTKINEVGVITLINILNDNFKGNREAMANYIQNNLPVSIESMIKNKEFKEKSKVILSELQKIFANSRKVEFSGSHISNKRATLIFKSNGYVYVDYFRRKLSGRVEYKSIRLNSFKNELHLTLEL